MRYAVLLAEQPAHLLEGLIGIMIIYDDVYAAQGLASRQVPACHHHEEENYGFQNISKEVREEATKICSLHVTCREA